MKLPGEEESGRGGLPVFYMVVGVSAFMLVLLFVLLKSNNEQKSGSDYLKEMQQQQQEEAAAGETEELEAPERKLRAEDLDFWDMYPVEGEENGEEPSSSTTPAVSDKSVQNTFTERAEKEREEQREQEEQEALNDPSTDGKHTLVTNPDGTDEWVLISPYLNKCTYDFTKMEDKAGLKRYMENGKKISYVGTDISKQTGNVNFASLKAAGVDYVMIRLGGRGYSSGQITLDENFKENIEGAIAEGLDVGVYFYSQAINQDEAIEEVNFIVQNLEPYRAHVKYPVAFDMEFVANDEARIDGLSREEKTSIATFFLDGVKAAGYVPMIYGDKEWLIKEVDLAKLQNYDVWLTQEEDIPDYPYQYAMWQYSTKGVLNGIKGDANLNICFIGYSQR
ncbi:MAG: glycoside hydrolase family 25 protein [Lachnospiraceae bacterium]|nr:glycoside hydrolase family 25 protein [Lachnospiraceae bacterium]